MKILIIGSKGMLGGYMSQVFFQHDLVLWDKNALDITDQEQVNHKIIELKPEIIINCVAYNDVDSAEKNRELANLLNGNAVMFLSRVAKKINAILVHYSTGYVFSGKKNNGYLENDKPDPINSYGYSKFLGEQEVQKYADKFYVIRTSRLFGKAGESEHSKTSFVDLIINVAKKNNNKVSGVDEEYDLPTYAFDLAVKTKEIIDSKLDYGIYHVTNSGEACTWYGFAKEIFRLKKMNVEMNPVNGDAFGVRLAKRPPCIILKNSKLKYLRSWQEALKEYLLTI